MSEDHGRDDRPGPSKAAAEEERGDKEAPDEAHAKRDGSDSDLTAEQPPEPPFYTPGCPSTTQEEEAAAAAAAAADPDEVGVTWANRAFLAWVLCGVGAAIIVIPLAFVLMPLLFPSEPGRPADQAVFSPSKDATDGPHVIPDVIAPSCILPSPEISGDIKNVRNEDYVKTMSKSGSGPREFFCLYNNSRYHNPPGRDFLPMHVPFHLCPKLVYWSMAVTDGNITSRKEDFDQQYGLYQLRGISKSQLNSSAAVLLMTLGGYPEDSGHFHRLAANHTIRHRLVGAVYKESLKYGLNGTNVHWVRGSESCERDLREERWQTLSRFLDDVRALLSLNEFQGNFTLSVMIDPYDLPDVTVLNSLGRKTDIVFITTHLLRPEENTLQAYCQQLPNIVEAFLKNVTGNGTVVKNACTSGTLALPAWTSPSDASPFPAQPVSKTEGKVAMSDVCSKTGLTRLSLAENCVVLKGAIGKRDIYIALDNMAKVGNKYRTATSQCVLVYDIDFDNFFERCDQSLELFLVLNNFQRIVHSRF